MPKPPPAQKRALDIFKDDDLNNAQIALAAAIEPPFEGEEREKHSSKSTRVSNPVVAAAEPLEGRDGQDRIESTASEVEATNAHLKFRVRQTTRARFDTFRAELSVALGGARLMDSNVGRALLDWFLFEVGEGVLIAVRRDATVLQRPASDDVAAMSAFDEALQAALSRALREAGAASR